MAYPFPDPRLMVHGRDTRRAAFSPTDQARAEGLVARYGGILETSWVGSETLVVQWTDPQGHAVRVEGTDPAGLITLLAQRIELGDTIYPH